FYTLRDLFAKGQKPSSIRFLLLSVPYRRQLNFTDDGLRQAENSVERLRNFLTRAKTEKFAAGETPEMDRRIAKAETDFDAGLADDLNTAVALAALFDLVRDANSAMDRGEFRQQDAMRLIAALEKFDRVLALFENDDAEKLARLGFGPAQAGPDDEQVQILVDERQASKKRRDFQRADEIRKQLADSGIILEDKRDGSVLWKRK
ncbi:MAG: DALR domain-containing protein, partial [Candidatus Acidiferrales bacterium]